MNHEPLAVVKTASPAPSTPWSLGGIKLFGDDGFNFRDVLDLINPLQHIPVIGNIYRKLTGDVAAPAIRIAGGALFGGPLGAAFAAANVVLKRLVKPDLDPGALPAADKALASQSPAKEPHGGWTLANSHAFPLRGNDGRITREALSLTDAAKLKKTYGTDASEQQRRHLFGSFHYRA